MLLLRTYTDCRSLLIIGRALPKLSLRFDQKHISYWAFRYEQAKEYRESKEPEIESVIAPRTKARGFFNREDFFWLFASGRARVQRSYTDRIPRNLSRTSRRQPFWPAPSSFRLRHSPSYEVSVGLSPLDCSTSVAPSRIRFWIFVHCGRSVLRFQNSMIFLSGEPTHIIADTLLKSIVSACEPWIGHSGSTVRRTEEATLDTPPRTA